MGGVLFTPDLNLTRWLLEAPGIIDRTADPLYFIFTPSRFPELLPTTIREVSDYVLTAIGWYYQYNTRPGCVDQKTKNFDYDNDSSYCRTHQSYKDMTLGRLYQTCTTKPGKGESLQWCTQNCSCEPTNWYLLSGIETTGALGASAPL